MKIEVTDGTELKTLATDCHETEVGDNHEI